MILFNFHIFDGKGKCLFSMKKDKGDESDRLLYGFLWSLKSFSNRITPVILKENHFFTYTTNCYQLVFMEMQTSVKFVLVCSKENKSNEYFKQLMKDFYADVYVEYHVKNPLKSPNSAIDSLLFREKFDEFFSKV